MSSDWPAWATEKVDVRAHDPAWAEAAHRLVTDLEARLEPWLDGRIEHVGSTSVPGLPAKPIVDLMAPVTSLLRSDEAQKALEEAGWHLVPPDLDQRPWRRLYVLPDQDRRIAHLQLVERASTRWRETVAFRDALRSRPDLAAEYTEVKRAAAAEHREDREAYTEAKGAFVRRVLEQMTSAEGSSAADSE